jgi:hypothetical protein
MKMGIATRSLLAILCLTLSAPAFAQIIFTTGPINGTVTGFFVTGPNQPNSPPPPQTPSIQDISDKFVTTSSGGATAVEWGEWSVGAPTSFAWSLATDSSGAFTQNLGNATVAQNSLNSVFLVTNSFGYGVYDVTAHFADIGMPAGTYWLTISNATDAAADGSQAWDVNGAAVICNYRQSGTNLLACGSGTTHTTPQSGEGEAFTISGSQATTPEPSSILLLGSGILGLFGILRRKLNT